MSSAAEDPLRDVHPAIVQSIKDQEHLRILSQLYVVEAGVQIAVGAVAVCLALFGAFFVLSAEVFLQTADMMRILGWMLALLGGLVTVGAWTQAILDFAVSKALTNRTRRKFCMFVASGECLFVPFGTVLAIATFLVLTRASVRPIFDDAP